MSEQVNYNNGKSFNISNITKKDENKALKAFAEGSLPLERCLRALWRRGLYTKSCCKGDHFESLERSFSYSKINVRCVAYIAFQEGVDAFSFLSKRLIKDPLLELVIFHNRQVLYYYGIDKNVFFNRLALDVLTGKKNYQSELDKKIGMSVSARIKYELECQHYINNGVPSSVVYRIKKFKARLEVLESVLGKIDVYSEESSKIIDEINKINHEINELLVPYVEDKKNSKARAI